MGKLHDESGQSQANSPTSPERSQGKGKPCHLEEPGLSWIAVIPEKPHLNVSYSTIIMATSILHTCFFTEEKGRWFEKE